MRCIRPWSGLPIVLTLTACSDPIGPTGEEIGWVSVTSGVSHACAASAAGDLVCWGSNEYGELGGESGADVLTPRPFAPGFAPRALSAGHGYTCAQDVSAGLYCWGLGELGQLGWGLPTSSLGAVAVEGGDFDAFGVGRTQACAVQAGQVLCWGLSRYGYSNGVPVDLRSVCSHPDFPGGLCVFEPQVVPGATDFVEPAVGSHHVCAINTTGEVHCWGENRADALGTGSDEDCLVADPIHGDFTVRCLRSPRRVALPSRAEVVGASTDHSCALLDDGSVWCWGATAPFTAYGQLGHGSTAGSATAVRVASEERFVALTVSTTVCALNDEGRAFCWGAGRSGGLGVASTPQECDIGVVFACASAPVAVETEERFTQISAGSEYVCARSREGRIFCWGLNDRGQLGDGATESRYQPREIDVALPTL